MLKEQMARSLSLSPRYIMKLAVTASHRYKHFTIRKANGGNRDIFHPAKELKAVQRWLQSFVVRRFPVHEAAAAYRKKLNIADHARRHRKSRYLLRVDLSNFFESISTGDVAAYLTEQTESLPTGWGDDDTLLFTQLICRNGRLTIGAITSPGLSNALCFPLDKILAARCADMDVTYSRYADDLFFSTTIPRVLAKVPAIVADTLKAIPYPATLTINAAKTHHSSLKNQRRVTGLVLTTQGSISLGRGLKRKIRSQIHKADALGPRRRHQLAGLLAFVKDVEPDFFNRLVLKYGETVSRAAHFKG